MVRVSRAESKERTRQRLLTEAQRLFRERGYAATSLEQIAEAAEVTKGAIYGHFSSKEDLMITAIEQAAPPEHTAILADESRPLRDRLAAYGRAVAAEKPGDTEEVAMYLEFFAALLRAPDALHRYSTRLEARLHTLAAPQSGGADEHANSNANANAGADATGVTATATGTATTTATEPDPAAVQAWTIGQAMLAGLQIYRRLAPTLVTPDVFEKAFTLLADLDRE